MTANSNSNNRISAQFRQRLEQMKPEEQVRAIVMPVYSSSDEDRSFMTRTERRDAAASALVVALGELQAKLDVFLASAGGRRLTGSANRLGHAVIEAPASTLLLLAEQPWVSAILEDQDIGLLNSPVEQ